MERKANTGVIYIKDKKNDHYPDFAGEIDVDGKPYAISLWKTVSKKGLKYLYAEIKPPYVRKKQASTQKPYVPQVQIEDDDCPF